MATPGTEMMGKSSSLEEQVEQQGSVLTVHGTWKSDIHCQTAARTVSSDNWE